MLALSGVCLYCSKSFKLLFLELRLHCNFLITYFACLYYYNLHKSCSLLRQGYYHGCYLLFPFCFLGSNHRFYPLLENPSVLVPRQLAGLPSLNSQSCCRALVRGPSAGPTALLSGSLSPRSHGHLFCSFLSRCCGARPSELPEKACVGGQRFCPSQV